MSDDRLLILRAEVADHLEEICELFTRRPKITIVIRTPWLQAEGKDGDVLLTDDDFDLVIAAIQRLRSRPIVSPEKHGGGQGPEPERTQVSTENKSLD